MRMIRINITLRFPADAENTRKEADRMLATPLVTLREGIEAFLIVAITGPMARVAWRDRSSPPRSSRAA